MPPVTIRSLAYTLPDGSHVEHTVRYLDVTVPLLPAGWDEEDMESLRMLEEEDADEGLSLEGEAVLLAWAREVLADILEPAFEHLERLGYRVGALPYRVADDMDAPLRAHTCMAAANNEATWAFGIHELPWRPTHPQVHPDEDGRYQFTSLVFRMEHPELSPTVYGVFTAAAADVLTALEAALAQNHLARRMGMETGMEA